MSGQVGAGGTRIFGEQGFHDQFVEQLAKVTASLKPGDPLAPGTFMGPLVSREQFDRVKSYLEVGKKEGAKVEIGGDTGSGKGYFVNPTIFTGVKNNMRIAREEIFGPVAAVIPFKDETDAVLQGNDTTYGLAG